MKIKTISIGRLYNLGNYEHVRYELSADVGEGGSAEATMIGLEKIIGALSPKTATRTRDELNREARRLAQLYKDLGLPEDEFRRKHGYFEGTPQDYAGRCMGSYHEDVAARLAWQDRSLKARKQLDDLGGAAIWKDSKLDWESDDDFNHDTTNSEG